MRSPAASEALRCIGSDLVLERLIAAKRGRNHPDRGCSPRSAVWRRIAFGRRLPAIRSLISSLRCCCSRIRTNWIADDAVDIDLKFLIKQNLQ